MTSEKNLPARVEGEVWKIWEAAQFDDQYCQLLRQMKLLEPQYEQVLRTLKDEQRDIICEYVSQCEGMSRRMLQVACTLMRFPTEDEK